MTSWIDSLLATIPLWAIYVAVFVLPFLEASVLLGFVVPGETILVFAGVLASKGGVSVAAVLALGIAGAILGDNTGYAVGRRYGRRIQGSRLGRLVGARRWDASESFLLRYGAAAVFLGRFTALFRAMVPGVAGVAGVKYRTFLVWNAVGGVAWATLAILGGWALGEVIATYVSDLSYLILTALLLAVLLHLVKKVRRTRSDRQRTGTVDRELVGAATRDSAAQDAPILRTDLDVERRPGLQGADSLATG